MSTASPSRDSTHTSNESISGESSVNDGVKRISRSIDSRSRDLVLPNDYHERPPSNPNIEAQLQAVPSGVEVEADTQSVLRDAQKAAKSIHPPWGSVITVASASQDAQKDLDTADNIAATDFQPLRIFDAVIGEIADVHPYAKMALGVLSRVSKIILAQADRDKEIVKLLDKLVQVYRFMTEDKDFRFLLKPAVLGQISQQTLECAHFITDYSEAKNFCESYKPLRVAPSRYYIVIIGKRLGKNVVSETNNRIQEYSDVLDALMQNFRDETIRDVTIVVHSTGDEVNLNGMTCAAGAGLNTRKRCLEGTRTDILSDIMTWINSSEGDVERVLWLSGPAGTGKSAIAHTIASSFIGVGGLGSCYCFDQARDAENRHEKIFSTIARDLADRHPEMKRALADAVQNATTLKTTADVFQQWQKFLIEPLGKLSEPTVGPVVIVIEALDESGTDETRHKILSILAGTHRDPAVTKITALPQNFRIIVTSRPLPDIEHALTGAQHIRRMSMDDIPPAVANCDIRAYISKQLEGLSHFGDKENAVLAEKSGGLFEWARLACACINTPRVGFNRKSVFNAVVSSDPAKRANLLYEVYDVILTGIMQTDEYNADFRQMLLAKFRSVMAQILGTAEPLPLASLNTMRSHFPDESDRYGVEVIIESMGPLLSGTTNSFTPIRPLHVSFRDFLTDASYSKEFFVDVSKVQRDLAFASLGVMEHGLRFNICDLKSSYLPNCEDPGLQERVKKCIPPHLSYSSRFWITHIIMTIFFDEELAKEVKSFFDGERLFFWLEVLALTHALSGGAAALPLTAQWLKGLSKFKDISSTALDVQRFIQVFGGIILHSTPHLYVSALPFSPAESPLSRKISAWFPNTLHVASGRDMNWPAIQAVLRGHTDTVTSASFSPDGTRIVTGSEDATVRLWDAVTGKPVGEPMEGHTKSINSASFSPNGAYIVTCSKDETVRLWDSATRKPVGEPMKGHTKSINSVSFSPDGNRIVTGSDDCTVRLWDTATGKPVGEPLRGHTESVNSVSFSPDGNRIVTGSEDATVRLWDSTTGQPVGQPLEGHTKSINSVSFSPDGARIVTGSRDRTVRLWDVTMGQPLGEPLEGHTDLVHSVSFSPDGTRIVTGSSDKTARLWDAATGKPLGEPFKGHTDSVASVSFSPDGTRIVTSSQDKTVRLWNATTGQSVGEPLEGHTDSVNSVSFSSDETLIATASSDHTVRLWDAVTGQLVGEPLRGHTGLVHSVSFSPDGTCIVTGSSDKNARLWDLATLGQSVGEPLEGHADSVNSVLFSPDETLIATASSDHTVRLWDAVTGQLVGEPLRGHTGLVHSVSFSPDGTHIVTGSSDKTVRLWDVATGKPLGEPFEGHTDWVWSVSFSPDGTRIVTGSQDKTVRLWDAATGQAVGEPLEGHTESVNSVSFSPDGIHIVTGSDDCTVRLWDVVTGLPVGEPLLGHSSVNSVLFSPDGTRILATSSDHVRVWYAVVEQPLQPSSEKDPLDERRVTHPTESTTTTTNNTGNNHSILFSSDSTHVLCNAAELMEGASHDDRRATSFLLNDDGWMVGPDGRLLFWVPPASRNLFYSPGTALVIPRGGPELDLSRMAHGQHWQKCRAGP